MRQNKYDDPAFYEKYSEMGRSIQGLAGAGEWYVLQLMLPELSGKRVLDLGCGYGWHCRYALEQGASRVIGVDLSEKMLARARELSGTGDIEYRQMAIEDIDFEPASFDVVLSSLAIHYVERFDQLCRSVRRTLAPGGSFVLSLEHPVFTSRAQQEWHYDAEGAPMHWPVDDYQDEGVRHTRFLGEDVTKYHRTVATYLNTLLASGFALQQVAEPEPAPELAQHPDYSNERRRPMFLLLSAVAI
ncbi:class I SAM-dependent methyltransferase [Paenibacillus daejeonensis]|uniref:class I SAM-dependent methyltransferase n=1 Tax=Paenibacillus daejeonensis TaxID=135193 RepID=UPI0003777F5A|nr:class I SAM-dependent methyltransferase [Paenibacillus daejeonensis]